MQFKQLEIKPEGNRLKRAFTSARFKRTVIAIIVGAIAGFGFFYLTEGQRMESIPAAEILKSMAFGGFFGLFITNSPCARGRC